MKKKFNIGVVTGTRADYGLLRPILLKMKESSSIHLKLFITGSHLNPKFGETCNEIIQDGFDQYIKVVIPLDGDGLSEMAYATGVALEKFAKVYENEKLDLVMLLGDRYEIFAAAAAACLETIPIAHLSGGDVTEGAIDDSLRHAITKLSYLHFVGCEESAHRVIQMGEDPTRVFNVGEPGVENCLKMDKMSRQELVDDLQFDGVNKDFILVTFHPVTTEGGTEEYQVKELIKAMDEMGQLSYIVTLANADAGGRAINNLWIQEGKKRKNWLVVPSLGVRRYVSLMQYACAVLGNSSSGIVEAPALGIPTVNIGDRQKGRIMAESVISCKPEFTQIVNAISFVLNEEFYNKAKKTISPFGDGSTSEQIVRIVLEYLCHKEIKKQKKFYDIDF